MIEMPYPECSAVRLRQAVEQDGVTFPAGTRGVIVVVHGRGIGYEVEFSEPNKQVLTLRGNQLDLVDPDNPPITADDVWHPARPQIMRRIAEHDARRAARVEAADSKAVTSATTDHELACFLFGDASHLTAVEFDDLAAEQQRTIGAARVVAGTGAKDDLHAAHARSLDNRSLVEAGGPCGCFYRLENFDGMEVIEWVDQSKVTALCPRCQIDTVLSSRTDLIDAGFLRRMHDYWFEDG